MSSRPVRVSELTGAAAEAVEAARRGEAVTVTADGEGVARIVPFDDTLERRLARVAGHVEARDPLGTDEIDDATSEAVGR